MSVMHPFRMDVRRPGLAPSLHVPPPGPYAHPRFTRPGPDASDPAEYLLLQVVQRTSDGGQGGLGDVGVDLGRTCALMTEELLDDAEVGAAFEQVGGEAVS